VDTLPATFHRQEPQSLLHPGICQCIISILYYACDFDLIRYILIKYLSFFPYSVVFWRLTIVFNECKHWKTNTNLCSIIKLSFCSDLLLTNSTHIYLYRKPTPIWKSVHILVNLNWKLKGAFLVVCCLSGRLYTYVC
jgi:hypothetical protein